ncbi:MAG: AgmX/PglI C-terminal domain-containing protein [Myxococcales bacterium FL481]|nr:MAG: AgmX/PglI C-terminal domain-containing protein [Myxococcales bacterium FL481]
MTSSSQPGKVLRIGLAIDGRLVDKLHQLEPASVTAGRALDNTLVVGARRQPRDYRRFAALWLVLGVALIAVGGWVFGEAVLVEAQQAAAREAAGEQLRAFVTERRLTWGDLGFALIFLGLVPAVRGFTGLWEPRRTRAAEDNATTAGPPLRHRLFEFRDGRYYLDAPRVVTGKVKLGGTTSTLSKLRRQLGQPDRLRVALPPNARGKLLLGDATLLFQMVKPAPKSPTLPFPAGLRSPFRLLKLDPLDWQAYAVSMVLVGGYLLIQGVLAEPQASASADDRMIRVMGITYEDEPEAEPEPAEEEPEPVLAQEDEAKPEEREKEIVDDTKVLTEKPKEFSKKAVEKARGVGIARVLGTYGGPGEGTVFDVISSTENNLGELFAMGMTQTVMADGGGTSPFVAGGEGITAHGAMVANEGLATAKGPAVEAGRKRERKVKGKVKSSTTDIYGDIDKRAVNATIRRRMSALQHCYEKALRSMPGLKGKIAYSITVSPMGRVSAVVIEEDTLRNPAVRNCTKAKIKGWRFPADGAEEASEVTFSVVFSGAA